MIKCQLYLCNLTILLFLFKICYSQFNDVIDVLKTSNKCKLLTEEECIHISLEKSRKIYEYYRKLDEMRSMIGEYLNDTNWEYNIHGHTAYFYKKVIEVADALKVGQKVHVWVKGVYDMGRVSLTMKGKR